MNKYYGKDETSSQPMKTGIGCVNGSSNGQEHLSKIAACETPQPHTPILQTMQLTSEKLEFDIEHRLQVLVRELFGEETDDGSIRGKDYEVSVRTHANTALASAHRISRLVDYICSRTIH